MDDDAIGALFVYIKVNGEVSGVLTYSSIHEWLKCKGITFREIDNVPYWSKACEDGSVIFHTNRGGEETYIKVWTEKAGELIGFKLDHDETGVLMMNMEDQESSSDGIRDKQDAQMRKEEHDRLTGN